MSRPKSESGPVLNWSSPDQNSDLGRPRSEFSSGLDQFRTGLAKIRILGWLALISTPVDISNRKYK